MLESRVKTALEYYEKELVYLGLQSQILGWFDEAALKPYSHVSDALPILDDLFDCLQAYSPIRPQADTRTEEAERAPRRLAAEDAILEVATRWRELMDRPIVEDDDEPDELWAGDPAEAEGHQLRAEVEELRGEVERLRRADMQRQAEYAGVAKERADPGG